MQINADISNMLIFNQLASQHNMSVTCGAASLHYNLHTLLIIPVTLLIPYIDIFNPISSRSWYRITF